MKASYRFWLHSKNFGLKQLHTTVESFVTNIEV